MVSDDVDAEFEAIMAGQDVNLDDEEDVAVDWDSRSNKQLMDEFIAVKAILQEKGALLHPKTDEERGLQSRYFAILFELKKRKLK